VRGPRITVTSDDRGLVYQGYTEGWTGDPASTDRWARITLRDSPWSTRPTCYEVALSNGMRFGGEMDFHFVNRRCLEWVSWGVS
jgi:hypothetical protein